MVQLDESSRPDLWLKAFSPTAFVDQGNARDRLKRALLDMEVRAGQLATEIARDMPEFTQHDASHTYALWEIANHVAGPDVSLNPAEAYVLGGAILVHDLAMSRAAHRIAGKELRERKEWLDALAGEIRKKYGRSPRSSELSAPPEDLANEADKRLLRSLHAEIAEDLPTGSWESLDGKMVYLITDPELRQAYGRIIGRVAASHHWNSDEITNVLSSPVGAPAFAPIEWRVDTLVLACLLRTADAAHLDAARVPDLLAAARGLSSSSKDHWLFQSRIQRPYLKNGRLVFTAPEGFSAKEIGAWWLAYETLSMVDEELRNTDSILADNGRPTFAARGAANVESPKAFSAVAPCREWEPVEAKIKVNDVAGLVRRLGANELYGDNWVVGLREIATNACDAVKAREALSAYRSGRPFAGRVSLWLEMRENKVWLACDDNGIGMPPAILGGKLLDFGTTSWLSADVVRENPGLLASKFEPSGRFGIGFFSVFMMGKRVQVTSRSVSGGPADTWVLEFSDGVDHRPILRKANHEEQLDEPGTTIKVQLDDKLCEPILADQSTEAVLRVQIQRMAWRSIEEIPMTRLIGYLLPAAEVDIWASDQLDGQQSECVVSRQDWVAMDGIKLLRRVFALPADGLTENELFEVDDDLTAGGEYGRNIAEDVSQRIGHRLQLVHDVESRPAGRIAMFDSEMMEEDLTYPDASIVTAGPARTSTSLSNVGGILIGKPHGAAREFAMPLASYSSMGTWIDSQIELLSSQTGAKREGWATAVAELAWRLERDAKSLPCWRVREGWIDYSALVHWIAGRDFFYFSDMYNFRVEFGPETNVAQLDEGVVSFDADGHTYLSGVGNSMRWPKSVEFGQENVMMVMFMRALQEAWDISPEDARQFFRRSRSEFAEAGNFEGRPLVVNVVPVSR